MKGKLGIFIISMVLILSAGAVQAQYGIGRFERVQIMASDLEDSSRALYLRAERQYPRFRSDFQVLQTLRRVQDRAIDFRIQVERNFDNPDAIRRAYQRLYSAWYDAQYVMDRGTRMGFLVDEFEVISSMVHELSNDIIGMGYRGPRYDRDRDYDDYEDDEFDYYDDDR